MAVLSVFIGPKSELPLAGRYPLGVDNTTSHSCFKQMVDGHRGKGYGQDNIQFLEIVFQSRSPCKHEKELCTAWLQLLCPPHPTIIKQGEGGRKPRLSTHRGNTPTGFRLQRIPMTNDLACFLPDDDGK